MPYAIAPDKTQIHYRVQGRGEALLMIMGQGLDHSAWGSLPEEYAQRFRVIVYDHRGTGASDKPQSPEYSTRAMAQDAVAVLDHAGVDCAHVYGISMGGRIAQWLAVDCPERVASLILACSTPGNRHGVARPKTVDALFATGNREKMRDLMVSPQWYASNPEFQALWQQQTRNPPPLYAQKLHYLASQAHNCWEELQTIAAPTLLIHGSDDLVNLPANSERLRDQIPGSTLLVIEGGKHFFFFEQREETNTAIFRFIKQCEISY